jgi:hypothetical protein
MIFFQRLKLRPKKQRINLLKKKPLGMKLRLISANYVLHFTGQRKIPQVTATQSSD